MGLVPVYDPLLDDLQDKSVIVDSAAPVSQTNGYFSVVDDIVYYFAGSHRYKITATLDDPVGGGGAGTPMGLLLTLTYPT